MKVIVNGESREVAQVRTLPELLEALGMSGAALLVEHNGLALHRKEWAGRPVAEGDRFEFLTISAGG